MGQDRFQPRSGVLSEDSLCAVSQLSWPEEWGQEITVQVSSVDSGLNNIAHVWLRSAAHLSAVSLIT